VRRLIVNADDFGLTPGVNRAIFEAQRNGIVTSATLMANSAAFDEAAAMARALAATGTPFSVGCHVMLMDGQPLLPPTQVPSLLAPGGNGASKFRDDVSSFALASFRGKLSASEIEAEATAQFQRLLAAGVQPSHFDTHKHAHMFPAALKPLLRAARAAGVKVVRNPFGQLWPLPFEDIFRRRKLWLRFAEMSVLRNFAGRFRREVQDHGLKTPDGSMAVLVTGTLDCQLFTAMMDALPEGTWEFVCHPGYSDSDLDRVRTRLRRSREQELELLTSTDAREILRQRNIELITFHEL
jgi:predicted glycoside hydrolase/deacetylase ChbG (UPF0249 family)